jgi:hypothetical protein
VAVFVASIVSIRSRCALIVPNVRLRTVASTSSGNHPATTVAHSARLNRGPPGETPAASAGATYLRTVLGSTPKLAATTTFGRPACQCCNTSITSIISNALLAITPRSPRRRGGSTEHKEPNRGPTPPRPLGKYVNGEVGNYVIVNPTQLGNSVSADKPW